MNESRKYPYIKHHKKHQFKVSVFLIVLENVFCYDEVNKNSLLNSGKIYKDSFCYVSCCRFLAPLKSREPIVCLYNLNALGLRM